MIKYRRMIIKPECLLLLILKAKLDLNLSHLNSDLNLTTSFFKIHFSIILLPLSWSFKWSICKRIPCQNTVYIAFHLSTLHVQLPSSNNPEFTIKAKNLQKFLIIHFPTLHIPFNSYIQYFFGTLIANNCI
jgi:hypothetical protein